MQDVDRIYVVLLQPSFASPNTRQEASADDAWNTCVEGFSQVQIVHASVVCSKPCKRSRVEHVCPASECGKAQGQDSAMLAIFDEGLVLKSCLFYALYSCT